MKLVRNAGGHDYPFYESQKRQLEALMDFKLPEYTYDEKKAVREADSEELSGYRRYLKDYLDNIERQIEEIGHIIKDYNPDIVYHAGVRRTSGWFRHEIEAVILRWLILFRNVHHPTGISAYYLCCRA